MAAAALTAVRAVCPGIPVGISSSFWILPEVEGQQEVARAWTVCPDCCIGQLARAARRRSGPNAGHVRSIGVEAEL
ncbi:hypothetical protein [Deinococcus hopiensis]|uniref:hypothetical protein n=1 Tax=Deinococcus hopiensis TaxID=309885 RepID=UPI000A04E2A8|nr:hypothetical protein [Deinococcus hopiensis]